MHQMYGQPPNVSLQQQHPALNAEHAKLASTLSSMAGLGLGDSEEADEQYDETATAGGDDHVTGHEQQQQHHHQENHPEQHQSHHGGAVAFISQVRLGPPLPEDLKRSQDLATIDWFDDRARTPDRGFARSAYLQDREAMLSIDWNTMAADDRDAWRLLILNTMLMEKEQLSCDLAVLRTLWLPVFGGGSKKSKIKTLVKDPLFAQLDEQTLELFDRHRNLVVQLAQQRNAFFESRSYGEMVIKLANYAAKIDILFVEAYPSYVAAYKYYTQTNAKFAKFVEKQKANVDLGGKGFVDCLRSVIDHFDRFNNMYQDILAVTDPAHPDYSQTQKAVFVVLTMTEMISTIDLTCDQHLAVGLLESQFDPPQKGFYSHERRLLKRVKCSYFVKDKKRWAQKTCDAMLFNDMLIVAEEGVGTGKNAGQMRLASQAVVELDAVAAVKSSKEEIGQICREMEQQQMEMAGEGICLVTKKDRRELFFLNSAEQKEDFLATLNAILQKLKTEKRMKGIQ